jgi:hypothetical protein
VNVSSGGYVCSGVRFEDWNFKVCISLLPSSPQNLDMKRGANEK